MASEFAPCTEAQKQAVLDRLQVIRQNIADACSRSGRTVQDVTLMAVTKTVSPELIHCLTPEELPQDLDAELIN